MRVKKREKKRGKGGKRRKERKKKKRRKGEGEEERWGGWKRNVDPLMQKMPKFDPCYTKDVKNLTPR